VIEQVCFFYAAGLFLTIAVSLTVVDVMLLARLKLFYNAFYLKERKKVTKV
jgi:hypothetical protein